MLNTIDEAIEQIRRGGMVVVVDDEDRENEGDLIMAAEDVTPASMAFFLEHTSGLFCVPLEPERTDELDLPLMVVANTEALRTAFTVSVDYRHGTTTGISAHDRAATIRSLIDPATRPTDLNRPGHIFPLRYRPGGVLKRAGHTEATVDLCRLAGKYASGVLCEIVTKDKSDMARLPELTEFAKEHNLPIVTIADLIRYRRRHEKLVKRIAESQLPTEHGDFRAVVYENVLDGQQHVAMVYGEIDAQRATLVRVHSECLTGDVFGSRRWPKLPVKVLEWLCICADKKDAVLASDTRFVPTPSKKKVATPSTPISNRAFRSIVVSTELVRRFWLISGSPTCAS